MRPLARKIFLTQGLVVLLVFGISLFAWLSLGEARTRAEGLRANYTVGIAHRTLLADLYDLSLSRAFYFLEKQNRGTKTAPLQKTFYEGLDRVVAGVGALSDSAGGHEQITALWRDLRQELERYRQAIAQGELAVVLDDDISRKVAMRQATAIRERMTELTRDSRDRGELQVAAEIDALRASTQGAAGLAVVFAALAMVVGLGAAYGLTRTIHRPVQQLRAATNALARGEFDLRVEAHRRDEFGDLARAFNEMAARLHELDEMKSHFVSVVSHELKTPLTSMRDAIELLADGVVGDLTKRQKRLLTITREGMERLVAYVNGILDLTRFEAGQVRLVCEPVSLAEVVREQADLVAKPCADNDIRLEISVDPDLPPVDGDRLRLGQVVANLLNNAVKFTPAGGRITVTGVVESWQEDIAVGISVSDTGPGIDPRDREHIFDKFFQAAGSGAGRVQGAGIGLAIVKSLVEAHQGVVSVSSSPRHGSEFRVLLPAAARQRPSMAPTGTEAR